MAHHMGMSLVALTNVLERRDLAAPVPRRPAGALGRAAAARADSPRGWCCRSRRRPRPDEACPSPSGAARRARARQARHAAAPRRPAGPPALHHHGEPLRRGLQPLRGARGHPLAADGTRDNTGQFCYLKDVASGRVWSAAHQPVCAPADWYRAFLATDRVTFQRGDGDIETRTEIAVVPEDSAEVRRITVTNNGDRRARWSSPATARSCSRRPRPTGPTRRSAICSSRPSGTSGVPPSPPPAARARPRSSRSGACTWWTRAAERVGPVTLRDRPGALPRTRALDARSGGVGARTAPLSGTTGAVLDPIFALRTRVRLEPGQSASVAFTTLVADQPRPGLRARRPLSRPACAQRALDLAWTSSQVELRELHVTPGRRRGVPGAGRPPALLQRGAAPTSGRAEAQPRVAAAALVAGRLRRLAHPAGDHRCRGGSPHVASAVGGAPLLAPAGDDGGPGGAQRPSRRATSRTWTIGSPRRCTRRTTPTLVDKPGGVFIRRAGPAQPPTSC